MPEKGAQRAKHWLNGILQGGSRRQGSSNQRQVDDENPWFALQKSSPETEQQTGMTDDRRGNVRWMADESSPYGFSDDDGTLKQVDHPTWRRAFGATARSGQQRFVPREGTGNRWQGAGPSTRGVNSPSRGSTWLMQTVAAMVLVAGGLYVHHVQTPLAGEVQNVYQTALTKDDTGSVMPAVQTFLADHGVSLPVGWRVSTTVRFHAPVDGTIIAAYSATHPEVTYQCPPQAKVYAAGSGTVTKVVSTGTVHVIVIDHGLAGVTIYSGVTSPSVTKGEYVSAGQVIGHVSQTGKPQLTFAFEQNGKAVNPTSHLPGSSTHS